MSKLTLGIWLACCFSGCALVFPYDDYERDHGLDASASGAQPAGGFPGGGGFPSGGKGGTASGGTLGGGAPSGGSGGEDATVGGGGSAGGGGTLNGGSGGSPSGGGGTPTGGSGGVAGATCIPKTCAGKCGSVDDGCGNPLNCPTDCGNAKIACLGGICQQVAAISCNQVCPFNGWSQVKLTDDAGCGCNPSVICWNPNYAEYLTGSSPIQCDANHKEGIATYDCSITTYSTVCVAK
jgi:hypothetical protein